MFSGVGGFVLWVCFLVEAVGVVFVFGGELFCFLYKSLVACWFWCCGGIWWFLDVFCCFLLLVVGLGLGVFYGEVVWVEGWDEVAACDEDG